MYTIDKMVEDNVRRISDAVRMGRKILDYLKDEELGPLARQGMEKELERINYQMQIGAEFVRAYRNYLKTQTHAEKQLAAATAPKVEHPAFEAQLVA